MERGALIPELESAKLPNHNQDSWNLPIYSVKNLNEKGIRKRKKTSDVDVDSNIKREAESGFTQRSEGKIDYTTFGELTEIVQANWEAFENLFRNQRAFTKMMSSLNQLRGPIAHCCPLAEDEVVRLDLTVKDWFRLME